MPQTALVAGMLPGPSFTGPASAKHRAGVLGADIRRPGPVAQAPGL